jgi:predicted Zn-dependent peptidase
LRYGNWDELFLQLNQVDKVTKADIRRVANKVFTSMNRTYAEIDPPTAAPAAQAAETAPAAAGTTGGGK